MSSRGSKQAKSTSARRSKTPTPSSRPRKPVSRANRGRRMVANAEPRAIRLAGMPGSVVKVTPEQGVFRYAGSEGIGALVSTTTYISTALLVSPASPLVFPWLSATIARGFTEYRFTKLKFRFVTRMGSSVSATVPTIGTTYMAFGYDANDQVPGTGMLMESQEGCVTFPGNMNAELNVDLRKATRPYQWLMMPTQGETAPNDLRLECVGRLYYACEGYAANSVTIGRLYVDYEVEFRRHKQPSGGDYGAVAHYYAGNVDNTHPLGTSGGLFNNQAVYKLATVPEMMGVLDFNPGFDTIWFGNPGTYMVTAFYSGFTNPTISLVGVGGPTAVNLCLNWTATTMNLNGTSTCMVTKFYRITSGQTQGIQFVLTGAGTGTVDVYITGIPGGTDAGVPLTHPAPLREISKSRIHGADLLPLPASEAPSEGVPATATSAKPSSSETWKLDEDDLSDFEELRFIPVKCYEADSPGPQDVKVPEGKDAWLPVRIPPQVTPGTNCIFLSTRGVAPKVIQDYVEAHKAGFLHTLDLGPK